MARTSRLPWIDLVRMIALFCVILCHSVEGIYSLNIDFMLSVSNRTRVFAITGFTVGRLGVPLFLLITGYLMLDREYDTRSTVMFWKRSWLHLLICTVVWFLLYDIFLCIVNAKSPDLITIAENLLFLRTVNMSHVWYMPMILGIYVLIPFVANALKNMDRKLFLFPILFFTICAFSKPILSLYNAILSPDSPVSVQFSLGYSGGVYGLYLVFGYLVKTGCFKRFRSTTVAAMFLLTLLLAVIHSLWEYENNNAYNIWYDDLLLCISSVSLFELASRMKNMNERRSVNTISRFSFAIYLLHIPFRIILAPYVKALPCMLPIKTILIFTACLTGSYALAVVISKIPKIGNFILYIKEAHS